MIYLNDFKGNLIISRFDFLCGFIGSLKIYQIQQNYEIITGLSTLSIEQQHQKLKSAMSQRQRSITRVESTVIYIHMCTVHSVHCTVYSVQCIQCVWYMYGMASFRWPFSRRINHTPSTTLVRLGARAWAWSRAWNRALWNCHNVLLKLGKAYLIDSVCAGSPKNHMRKE